MECAVVTAEPRITTQISGQRKIKRDRPRPARLFRNRTSLWWLLLVWVNARGDATLLAGLSIPNLSGQLFGVLKRTPDWEWIFYFFSRYYSTIDSRPEITYLHFEENENMEQLYK
jgi:hypothetical protein